MNRQKEILKKVFCITGILGHFKNKKEAYTEILQRGGVSSDKLTVDCDYLVIGSKGNANWLKGKKGSKIISAEKRIAKGLPIKILTEEHLLALLEDSPIINEEEYEYAQKSESGKYKSSSKIKYFEQNNLKISENITENVEGHILKIDYSISCHSTNEEKAQAEINNILSNFLTFHNPNFIKQSSVPAFWTTKKDEVLIEFSKVIFFENSIKSLASTEQLLNYTKGLQDSCSRNLSIRLWHKGSYNGERWHNRFMEAQK